MKRFPSKKIKLLFCGHDFKFINSFISRCKGGDSYDVRVFEHKGHTISDEGLAWKHLEWADVIFCEWALGNAVWFSQHKRDNQTLIVRLHAQEIRARDRLPFIWQTDWDRVDRVIFITHHLYDWMNSEFPAVRGKSSLIFNPIDARGSLNLRKDDNQRFTLGLVGLVPALKRVDLAIDILSELVMGDGRYKLRIKGSRPEEYPWMLSRSDEMNWYEQVLKRIESRGLAEHVIFDPHGNDMAEWYSNIGCILSMSDHEGSHQAIAEGMASGCVPAIRNWTGADRIYPPKYVSASASHLVRQILDYSDSETFRTESTYCRNFSAARFDNALIARKLNATIFQSCWNKFGQARQKRAENYPQILPHFMIIAYLPVDSFGGYRIRVEQEIRQLIQAGCKVQLACLLPMTIFGESSITSDYTVEETLRKHKKILEQLGCTTHIVPITDFFKVDVMDADFRDQLDYLVGVVKATGVNVVHSEALYAARFGNLLKKRLPELKHSIDWHGIAPEEEKMGGGHINRVMALERSEKQLLKNSDLNIFVSRAMQKHYTEKYSDMADAATIVPCCVNDEQFVRNVTADGPVIAKMSENSLVFGYAGTMATWQCGLEMIRLFAQLHRRNSNCFFLILAPERDHAEVIKYGNEYGLPETALELRGVGHSEVSQYLQMMHVGVLLRRSDPVNIVSSPTKFGEYIAAGLPVLMTEGIGDYSQAATENGFGLIISPTYLDQDNFPLEEIERIINFACESRTKIQKIKNACQQYASSELRWEPVIERWIQSYPWKFLSPTAPYKQIGY